MLTKITTLDMSRDQNAGRSHIIKIDNSSYERVEQFRYLGNKGRLKSENACYY